MYEYHGPTRISTGMLRNSLSRSFNSPGINCFPRKPPCTKISLWYYYSLSVIVKIRSEADEGCGVERKGGRAVFMLSPKGEKEQQQQKYIMYHRAKPQLLAVTSLDEWNCEWFNGGPFVPARLPRGASERCFYTEISFSFRHWNKLDAPAGCHFCCCSSSSSSSFSVSSSSWSTSWTLRLTVYSENNPRYK